MKEVHQGPRGFSALPSKLLGRIVGGRRARASKQGLNDVRGACTSNSLPKDLGNDGQLLSGLCNALRLVPVVAFTFLLTVSERRTVTNRLYTSSQARKPERLLATVVSSLWHGVSLTVRSKRMMKVRSLCPSCCFCVAKSRIAEPQHWLRGRDQKIRSL